MPLPPQGSAACCACPPQVLRGALIAGPTGCKIDDAEKCGDEEGQPKVRCGLPARSTGAALRMLSRWLAASTTSRCPAGHSDAPLPPHTHTHIPTPDAPVQVRYDNSHFDTRADFVSNEVAIEYNSGWTAALAGLIALRA